MMGLTMPRSTISSDVQADVVAHSADISAFEPLWRELFSQTSSEPSTSFEWSAAMLQHHLEPEDRFFLFLLARAGKAIGLVPLVSRPTQVLGQRLTTLSPLSERYNTHGGLLARGLDARAIEVLILGIQRLETHWDIFRMSKLLEGTAVPSLLQSGAKACGLDCSIRYTMPTYFLELPETFETYLASRSPKFRQDIKRATRKLQSAGQIGVTILCGEHDFDELYEAMLAVERASWKQAHGTAITAVPRQTGFYRTMGRSAAAAGRLDLRVLTLDGTPIAHNLGYIQNGCYYYLKTSYDERRQALSPAMFLRAHLVESLIDRGVRFMDFHGEPYEWERRWTDTYRWHTSLTIYNNTLKGRAVRLMNRLRRDSGKRPEVKHCDPRAIEGPMR
jgi:CelD/BcsL family acetyltransferase involved in cellulose biosynthesis